MTAKETRLIRFALLIGALVTGALVLRASGQTPLAATLRLSLRAGARVATEVYLAQDFKRMRQAAPDPVKDKLRYRKDRVYRRAHEFEVRNVAERRKQLALQYLDRHADALLGGVGIYYRGLALKFADDCARAVEMFKTFRKNVPRHRARTPALLEIVDCLLRDPPRPATAEALRLDRMRLLSARLFLKTLSRQELTPEMKTRAAGFGARLRASRLRHAFFELLENVHELRREALLGDLAERVRKLLEEQPETMRRLLKKALNADEELYHASADQRRTNLRIEKLTAENRRKMTADFIRANRKDLETDDGLLWLARARKLGGDAKRAVALFRRFLARRPDHPQAANAGLDLARLLIHDLDDPAAALAVLETLAEGALAPAESTTVEALTERLRRELGAAAALEKLVGHAVPEFPGTDAVEGGAGLTTRSLAGRVTLLVLFAAWSAPSRDLLLRVGTFEQASDSGRVRVAGVTRAYGFGWETTAAREGRIEGKFAGPNLSPERERELCGRLWKTAGLTGPLVFTTAEAFKRVPHLPAVLVVDAEGVVRGAAAGRAAWARIRTQAEALSEK